MNKNEKLRKLGNAVREYRGVTRTPVREGVKTDWVIPPKPEKAKRIRELLALLRFDGEEQDNAMKQIDAFKTFDEFNDWIRKI
jgi:hypothetical protein